MVRNVGRTDQIARIIPGVLIAATGILMSGHPMLGRLMGVVGALTILSGGCATDWSIECSVWAHAFDKSYLQNGAAEVSAFGSIWSLSRTLCDIGIFTTRRSPQAPAVDLQRTGAWDPGQRGIPLCQRTSATAQKAKRRRCTKSN